MIEVILLKIVLLAKLFLGLGKASVLWAGKAPLMVLGLAATLALLVTTLVVGLAVTLSLVLAGPFFPKETSTGASR
jgi:hypothetical protein